MQIQVDKDRRVLQYGQGLGDREGCTLEVLDDTQADVLRVALSQPNGGVTITKDHKTINALPVPPAAAVVDPDDDLRKAIEAATTLPELKAALLGTNRPVRVAGRPI